MSVRLEPGHPRRLRSPGPPFSPPSSPPLFLSSHLLLFLAAFLFVPTARAQEAAMEGALSDSIVVTASRQAEGVRQTGRRLAVWTARDIEALPVTSFDELLRTVGGVEVQSRGGFGVQSDLTMRGSTFNGVLVLLDGARLNDPMTNHFVTDFPVPLAEIARIEVLRGPAAAVYGPDALGGVVQLFTYTGLQRLNDAAGVTSGQAGLQRGDFGLYDAEAALRHTTSRAALSAAVAWQGSDGMPIRGEAGQPIVGSQGAVRTDFARQVYTAAVAHAVGRATLYTRAGVDDRDFGAFHFYTPFASDTAREATTTYWAQVRLQRRAAASPWQVQLAARQHEDTYVYNPQTAANRHTSRLLALQGHTTHRAGRWQATAGAAAVLRSIESNNLGRHGDASAGAFLTGRWQAAPRLTLNASGRLDYDPGYGLEATPQASAAFNLARLTLRAAAGRAVRAPGYVERYFNTTLARPRGRDLGNPNLKAERAWSYEAGLDAYPLSGLSLHATAFTRRTRDLIDYAKLTPADTVFLARNLHRVRTSGLELDADLVRSFGFGRARLSAAATWLDADLGRLAPEVTYKYALTNARRLLQATAGFDVGPAALGLQLLSKVRLEGEGYTVVSARLAYGWVLGRQRLVLSGELRNLFDHSYTEVFEAPMPGRWWLVGLRLAR